ncbi:MAG: transcription-repair coupling factor [Bacteroidota bacterium]|nr:transcription-repair coupling factor [Bacteroidota bacterium]
MSDNTSKIFDSVHFQKLDALNVSAEHPKIIHGISGSLWAFVAVALFRQANGQVLVVVDEAERAEKLRDDCTVIIGEANVKLFISEPQHASQVIDMSAPLSQIETLKALQANTPAIYITHSTALGYSVPEQKKFLKSIIELSTNSEHNFEQLLVKLSENGFERKQFVESYGDIAVRGGILDIFPFIGEHPVRIEFWGDTIESIREFEVLSQRSIRELQKVSIVPDVLKRESVDGEASEMQTNKEHLLSYFSNETMILLEDESLRKKEFDELESEGVVTDFSFDDVEKRIENFSRIIHSSFQSSKADIDFQSTAQPSVNGSIKILKEKIVEFSEKGFDVVITSDRKEELERIQDLIESFDNNESISSFEIRDEDFEEEINLETQNAEREPLIHYSSEAFHSGFVFESAKIVIFTEHEIFNRIKARAQRKQKRFKGISAKELHALRRGDYVTHVDHGIGKFLGLEKISVGGTEQEVAKLEYAEKGMLFVNLNYITRIQKYSSAEGHEPKLNKLGTPDWERLKARTKKKIKDIARDLIKLYAKRKMESGFAFQPDAHWQKEMEASFMYDDTPDQARTTIEVKADMESPHPMDRLVCGDVGFGKTEIAIRAAFKSVMNGKQVGVLVPTTILAQQHFNTFSDRLNRYPIRIALLSRFKSSKEIKESLKKLADGNVDIVIGTHRLLSKDVQFKDLGLLVIDEEQRFGVAAKEKLRAMKVSVDTLTLTATPIPRTLHFSLMGARDLSVINTPPRNRLPVHTEIVSYDKKLIREAVIHEIHRGGQVFIVNDRVNNIETITATLQEHIPEARFRIAHGQMEGHELEQVMIDFLERKFDVLVTTKIVESGVDIPSVNTIIINRADKFGLAELYQLRGRVGRANLQAYAYLLVPPINLLPKQTLRRLQAIEEFTELGSGFNLAMRDLEIRGAGNMLGGEQSGFIMEMGFEMYTKILEDAVTELKEQEFAEVFASDTREAKLRAIETQVDADIEAYIPEFYIESDTERLDIYRRLYKTSTQKEVDELKAELNDRFGTAMEEVDNLFALASLRVFGSHSNIRKAELNKRTLRLFLPLEDDKQFYESGLFQQLMASVSTIKEPAIQLKQEGKNLFFQTFLKQSEGVERVTEAITILEKINYE